MKPRGDIPIIICCAEDDEPVLAKVVDELRREGLSPELVPGIEFDSNLLAAAVDAAAADALFVLCGSVALDKAALRRLTGLFSARSGPGQRIISTSFTPSRPLAVLPAIRGALKEMRLADERASAAEMDTPSTAHLRDVVEAFVDPAPPSRVPPRAEPVAPPKPVTHPSEFPGRPFEGVRPPANLPPTPARPEVVASREPAVAQGSGARPLPTRPLADGAPQVVIDDGVGRSLEQRLSGVPAMPDSMVSTDPETSGVRFPRDERMGGAPRMPVFDEPRGNRMLLVFAGVGIAGIVALALLQLLQPAAEVPGVPAKRGAPPAAAAKAERAAKAPAPPVQPVDAPPVVPAPTDTVVPSTPAAPTTPTAVTPPVVPPTPATPTDPTPPSGDVPPAPKAVSKRDLDIAALELAVGEGRLQRVGSLWVARAGDEDSTWDDAQRRCHGKRINGVQGFRLPGARELRKLRAAKVVSSGSYWTRETMGDEAMAFDVASGTTSVFLTIEPNARALCVRLL